MLLNKKFIGTYMFLIGYNLSALGVISELDTKNLKGKLAAVPVSCARQWRSAFPRAYCDREEGNGEGFPRRVVNSWAMGWSCDM